MAGFWILYFFQTGEMQYATAKAPSALVWAKFEISSDKWSILIGGSGGTHSFPVQCSMRGAVCQCICSSWGGLDVRNDNWIHIPPNYKLQCMPCWLVFCIIASFLKGKPQHPALQPGRWHGGWAGQDQGEAGLLAVEVDSWAIRNILCNASAITDACRYFLVLCNNSSGIFWDLSALFTWVLAQRNYSRITGFSFGTIF